MGKGPCETYLNKLSKELGVEKKVHLLGFRRDIPEICKISDLFVFPSLREGLPVSMMEAMACGLPVICSDIRGNRDLIQENIGGYLANPKDINAFVNLIQKLIYSSEIRETFGLNNMNRIEGFSIELVNQKLSQLYKV